MTRLFRQWRAHRRLNRMVAKMRESEAVKSYARHRRNALKGTRGICRHCDEPAITDGACQLHADRWCRAEAFYSGEIV